MAETRNVTVKLTAQVDDYCEAMDRAAAATAGLGDVLEKLGVTPEDMPAAIKSVLSIVREKQAS